MTKMKIEKNYVVEYSHRLPNHQRHCKYLHGHSGKIKVIFEGEVDDKTGMVVDFGEFGWLNDIIEQFDHSLVLQKTDEFLKYLFKGEENQEIGPLRVVLFDGPPTAENICLRLKSDIVFKMLADNNRLTLCSVSFEETEGNIIIFEV